MATSNETEPPEPRRPRSSTMLRSAGLATLILAVMIAATGIWRRHQQDVQVAQWAEAQAIPTVSLVTPRPAVSDVKLTLPGEIRAWNEAPIYARVNGYLKNWYSDYGAHVTTGQLLAEIDAPDLDAQLAAAEAKLNAANSVVMVRQAELNFAKTTYERWRDSPKGVVSVQETMSKKGDFETATARLNTALADVSVAKSDLERLQALDGFKRITAPFDGIVTERNTDVGALINAGSGVGGGSGPVLFRIADVHKTRIFVSVPQYMTAEFKPGLTARLRLPQFPKRVFHALVVTTSHSIDRSSRTLLVELSADNPDEVLQPGSYAEVQFSLPGNPEILHLPASALLFRQHGLKVAVVGDDSKISLKEVTLGRNLGTEVEILEGLATSDRVVDSPPDSLAADNLVRVVSEQGSVGKQSDLETKPE
jgi:RND family efflux transporter MFP subunit